MAIVVGTNCGFVTVRPAGDPAGATVLFDTRANAFRDTAPGTAVKVTEIGIYVDNATQAAEITFGIYTNNPVDNEPEVLVGSVTVAKGETSGWKFQSCDIEITAGNDYWIAAQLDNTATATNSNYTADAGEERAILTSQTTLINPWGTSSLLHAYKESIYAVWEAAGGEDIQRTINDSVGVTDARALVRDVFRTISESMGVTDVDSRVWDSVRTVAESLGITDALSKEESKIISESLGITDAISRVNVFLRTIADSMNISDEVTKVWEIIRSIDDSEGITDAHEAVIGQWITIADSLGITDSVIRLVDYLRTQDDDVGIADAIVKVAVALRTIDDDMGITDEMVHQLTGLMKAAWAFLVMRQTHS